MMRHCLFCVFRRWIKGVIARVFPRRYYKRVKIGRIVVWFFPFWWDRGEPIIGKSFGPITYFLIAK